MIKESYDIPKMKDMLLGLKRKLQGHGKRIVKITIPPTGVIAVTRSTGSAIPFGLILALTKLYRQTVYLTELPLPHVDPSLACPSNDPPLQGAPPSQAPRRQIPQRWASGSARNNAEFDSTDTWRAGMNHI